MVRGVSKAGGGGGGKRKRPPPSADSGVNLRGGIEGGIRDGRSTSRRAALDSFAAHQDP